MHSGRPISRTIIVNFAEHNGRSSTMLWHFGGGIVRYLIGGCRLASGEPGAKPSAVAFGALIPRSIMACCQTVRGHRARCKVALFWYVE